MYAQIERRTVNAPRLPETMQRGQVEFFPNLQAAPGFVSFQLVADAEHGINTAIVTWEGKAQADAFYAANTGWPETLEALGHPLLSDDRGELVALIQPAK